MANTYFTHVSDPDVRMKVCKKTAIIERNQYVNYDADDETKEWRYYTALKLPLTPDHAEAMREKYALPDEVVAKLKGQ